MKNVALVVFVLLLLGNLFFYKKWQNVSDERDGLKLEYSNYIDSALVILNTPPDTIVKEKVVKGDIVFVDRWNDPAPATANTYKDSLVNDSINIHVTIKADKLYNLSYAYKPIFRYKEKTILKNVPYPVEKPMIIKEPQSGLYINGGVGYGSQAAAKIGLMYLTKKEAAIGADFIRHGSDNVYLVSYGVKF